MNLKLIKNPVAIIDPYSDLVLILHTHFLDLSIIDKGICLGLFLVSTINIK